MLHRIYKNALEFTGRSVPTRNSSIEIAEENFLLGEEIVFKTLTTVEIEILACLAVYLILWELCREVAIKAVNLVVL